MGRTGRTALGGLLLTGLLATMLAAPPAAVAKKRTLHLGGVKVRIHKHTKQVITVNRTHGSHARVTFWRKKGGDWHKRRSTKRGRIGYGGLVKASRRHQGTGTTPRGTFAITESFGTHARPHATRIDFHRVRRGDYWVQDNRSAYYNQLRNKSQGGFGWWLSPSSKNGSERLQDYHRQYRWSIVIDFNRPDPVRHRGAGIFLHVNGDGATAGCVSAPRAYIKNTMNRLRDRFHPVIAIGT
ncbi:MAG: L,D-transpeptidase family protein [Nocardioidaceae bacterium]